MTAAGGEDPQESDPQAQLAALMDVADRAFQYADEAVNRAQRAAARSSTRSQERLDAVMFAAHAHWLEAERHHRMAQEAHADGHRSRLEHSVSEVIDAAVDTQRTAGLATTADALKEVLEGLKPAAQRAREAEAREQLEAELDRLRAQEDKELTAVTRLDATNRDLLRDARWRAENDVPDLGWWPALAADMAYAHQGRLLLDETGSPRLVKKSADGRVVAGRKVNAERVAMLRAAGFLVTGTDGETPTLLHPSDMGREALYLATLYPEGLHADERAAYEARYAAARRPWMNSEERKSAARRLPPLAPHAVRAVREKPVLLDQGQLPQISADAAAQHADMADRAQRLWRWAAMSEGERSSDAARAPHADGAQPGKLAGEVGQDVGGDDERAAVAAPSDTPPSTPGQDRDASQSATPPSSTPAPPLASEASPHPHHSASPDTTAAMTTGIVTEEKDPPHTQAGTLAGDWTLDLSRPGEPHSEESALAAWALRGVLADHTLIELLAAVDNDEAFSRWKSNHLRHLSEGTAQVNKELAPAESVKFKRSAKNFQAHIGDQTITMPWDRVRTWLRDASTPEVLGLLQAAETARIRLQAGLRGEALLAATGQLDVSRDLRAKIKQLITRILDHVIEATATTPIPTGRRATSPSHAEKGPSLFELAEAPALHLPGAARIRADLDLLNDYLPAPQAARTPDSVALSQLTVGTVLDLDDRPIVVTEIIRYDGRCDVIGEFRGPIRPARVKHSVELSGQEPDPLLPLAPVLPSLHTLTGRRPELDDEHVPGPLVVGHPARSLPAAPRVRREADPPTAPPVPRLPELAWDEKRRQAHGQALAAGAAERPPLSAARRELDPDDPYAQFTDNIESQLLQLARPDERTAVADAAREIREAAADLAARARAYSSERVRAAEGDPAQLLQITMEPSLAGPFIRIAMNTIMRVTDAAEASVTGAAARARVRAALAAVVCSDPPPTPDGTSPREFGDALIEIQAVASHTRDTVAELLAGPAQWAHFADLSARVEAATSAPDPSPPAPRFADVDDLRAHLADVAQRPLPEIEVDPAGLIRYELRGRAKFAGQLADEPTLELTPSRRLAIYGSAKDGWHVVAPGSADAVVPWSVKTRRHALRYATLLERLTDTEGRAYPWDADDFPPARTPYELQGGDLLYDWVESNQSHHSLGFQHRLRILREDSGAYRWMENLSLHGFESYDYIHPADPADLMPGDEVMFTFDQDELRYASRLAGYFPPLQGGSRAIGTAVVGTDNELIPGYWWAEGHPEQAQRLTRAVALREGVRRARPGEYALHAGITQHLPELTEHHAPTTSMMNGPSAQTETPQAETVPAPDTPAPTSMSPPAAGGQLLAPTGWDDDVPSALEAGQPAPAWDDAAPATPDGLSGPLDEPGPEQAAAAPVAGEPTAPAETSEPAAEPDHEARWRERLANNAAFGAEALGIDPSAGESFEGYAGRFDGDYDITLPSGRYCYRTPGFDRKKYSVRYITDPTRDWESKQIKAVENLSEIMPVVRRHAARTADKRDPRTVELNEYEQRALDDVARGIIFRSMGDWYRVRPKGGTEGTYDRTTHALWSLSALGLITVPAAEPETGHRQHAQLTDVGELRRTGQNSTPSPPAVEENLEQQTALFAAPEPTTAPVPDGQAAAPETAPSTGGTEESTLPRFSRERLQALNDIARDTISVIDGEFMLTNPRRPIRTAPSQSHLRTVLREGLAQETSGRVHLTDRGVAWFAHHEVTPATPARSVEAVEQAPLPPIDYTPLDVLPAPDDQQDGPRPPAPAPLPDRWQRRYGQPDEEAIQATLAMAEDAAARTAQSTARDVADLAAGPDCWLWGRQHPLAQFDENAAAALENVTDPLTRDYATRAVHHLRTALVEAGHRATDHYVRNVRSPEWRTIMGVQADDVHRDRVRGIVITYLIDLRTHAEEHGLDADTIVHVLEDTAGWTGSLRPLGQTAEYPHLPAAENVAEAAQHVANSLLSYARGETDTVDTHAERRTTWRPVGPRPDRTTPLAPEDSQERAGGLLAGDETAPGPDAATDVKVRFDRRFDLRYQVGQFVDHRDDNGQTVTARVVSDAHNPVLRDPDGHEFRAFPDYRRNNFLRVIADDGSDLPAPAWTASLPEGQRVVPPSVVRPGDVMHDYRENGEQGTSRLVIEVKEHDGVTTLTCVGLEKFSGLWVHYDHRNVAVLDETDRSRQLAETALKGREVRAFAKAFGISLSGVSVSPAGAARPSASPQQESTRAEQAPAGPQAPGPASKPATLAPAPEATGAEAAAPIQAANSVSPAPPASRRPAQERSAQAPDRTDPRSPEQAVGPRPPHDQTTAASAPAPAPTTPTRPETPSAAAPADRRAALADAEPAPEPAGRDEAPSGGTEPAQAQSTADLPADRLEPVLADTGDSPPTSPPAVVREEGTVATSPPPSAAATEKSVAPVPAGPKEQPTLEPATATAYADAAAYAIGHEALLAELDQHERWLAQTPAAAQAAAILVEDSTLGPESLTALLTLQRALTARADQADQRPRLVQHLGHHIQCVQLLLAKRVFGQAARSTHTDRLRELYEMAFHGGFIAFREATELGELELGEYLQHRAQDLTPPPADTEGYAEETPAMAEETTTVAADPDDDIQLPVFEMPGESIMTAEQAAPRLLAEAQTHLAAAHTDVELLAHVHGSPIYAMVDQGGTPAAVLHLGLTAMGEEGSPRAVSLRGADLAAVAPQSLLAAVTAWMNATDAGARPLLDYAPASRVQAPLTATPAPSSPVQGEAPAQTATAAPPTTAAPASDSTTSQPTAVQGAQEVADQPASAPERGTAPPPDPQAAPDATAPAGTVSPPAIQEAQTAPSLDAGGTPSQPEATAGSTAEQQRDGARPALNTPAPLTERPAPTEAERAAELTTLARAALTGFGVPAEATGVLTAPRTVVLTLETSGNAERDRETSNNLRAALTQAVREHPDQGLAAYRVDIEHTRQVGQSALTTNAPAPETVPVPRERLVAANNAAAALLAERLRTDPNAALARTYLAEERHLPPEIQQEWGLGYAPSDRSAGRFDVLVRELKNQGFTDEELLQAGLALRSKRDTLIDYLDDRIVFPIHDEHGDIVGFSGRRIDRPAETQEEAKERQSQKYFNTSNKAALFSKGDLVFGLHHPAQAQALAGSSGPRVSVEGYFDVIAVARAAATLPLDQRPVVGAPMGTAFTERQLTVLRGPNTDQPRPHIAFLDADDSGRKVLLDKRDLLLGAAGPTTVTTAPGAKDAAKLWEKGIEADGDGAAPVLRALEAGQPLLDATVEAVLVGKADEGERANHAFDSDTFFQRTNYIAAEAAHYIHQWVQTQAPGDTSALQQAALTWARRLHQQWSIPGWMTATGVLLGPGKHHEDYENEVYDQALDLLAADPEDYFANDSHVRSRQSAAEGRNVSSPMPPDGTAPRRAGRPGQWPTGTGPSSPASSARAAAEPAPAPSELELRMVLPGPVDGQPVEHTDRTTAAYALHAAVHERLGQHTAEIPEPDRLPQPLNLGTVHGVDLGTSGDDQTGDDPTVVLWLGPDRSDSLRLAYSRFVTMTGPELLAAVEWRAAQTAGLLGAPLSQTWRNAVRRILPPQFPAQPTPTQLADLLDTIAQGNGADDERTRHRAEQAIALYTAGHPDLALDHLASTGHIWVLKNDGSWIQEEAVDTELSWEELDNGFSQEAAELTDIVQTATALPPAEAAPMPADLIVAHHSAHEALAVLRPYSIGLPNTRYEKITDLVAQMDASEPALRRLHGSDGQLLMNRARTSFVRILEGLATLASKIRLTGLSTRLERTVARLRGQDPADRPVPRAVRVDRRMQDLAHVERDLERRMAAPTTTLDERGELQERWIINRARWRARYEQLHGQPPAAEFLPANGLVAGAPPVPNLIAAHELLLNRLSARVDELRDADPHTGEESNPYDPTADLFNGVAWAYQQRLVGATPAGDDPQGPLPALQLRQAALTVTSHQHASPLTLRRTLNVSAERADRLLHRLEEQQILGPYRADAPRAVLARPGDIDTLLARPAMPTPATAPTTATTPSPDALYEDRIQKMVSKILADQQRRSEAHSEPAPAERTGPASRVRKSAHKEAEANALAAGQFTSLAPSQA
ncbi:toprim domain-containing protein [Streptomyces sp. NPDC007088]|uniref:toprim domain-containing protein n=1 Tax=Streptomyces sp. NPDC007088 TaxID=3364773 RepID=UPI003690ECB2